MPDLEGARRTLEKGTAAFVRLEKDPSQPPSPSLLDELVKTLREFLSALEREPRADSRLAEAALDATRATLELLEAHRRGDNPPPLRVASHLIALQALLEEPLLRSGTRDSEEESKAR